MAGPTAVGLADVTRRAETAGDAGFHFALFCGSRPPGEDLAGLDAALAAQLLRHQFAGQDASLRAAFPQARRDIVEVGATPVGRIVVDEGADAWTLADVAILPAWRGQGIGKRLLTATMAEAQAAAAPVRLRVMKANAGAARLYARLGFMAVATSAVDVEMVWRAASLDGPTPNASVR
jgi:ribosomal protein S18 acetylase RimI-like enzyme